MAHHVKPERIWTIPPGRYQVVRPVRLKGNYDPALDPTLDPNQAMRLQFEKDLTDYLGRQLTGQEADALRQMGWPPDPELLDVRFWSQQLDTMLKVQDLLGEYTQLSAYAMIQTGPFGGMLMDTEAWGLIPDRAADWAANYTYGLVTGMNQQTMTMLQAAVSDWLSTSNSWDVLYQALQPVFGSGRAGMIAVTEVTRALYQGHRLGVSAALDAGLEMVEVWHTNRDANVCPTCLENDGKPRGAWLANNPPAHPGCRCWVTADMLDPAAITVTGQAPPGVIVPAGQTTPRWATARLKDLFQMGKIPNTPRWAPVRHALDVMSKLHGVRSNRYVPMKGIPIVSSRATKYYGQYRYWWRGGKKVADRILICLGRKKFEPGYNPHPDVTVCHETGHYLDQAVLGKGVEFASEISAWYIKHPGQAPTTVPPVDPKVQKVMELMMATPEYQRYSDWRSYRKTYTRSDGSTSTWDYPLDYLEYLRRPRETFARAYEQWTAWKSGDQSLMEGVNEQLADETKNNAPSWFVPWDRWEPIGQAMDSIFMEDEWQPAPGT